MTFRINAESNKWSRNLECIWVVRPLQPLSKQIVGVVVAQELCDTKTHRLVFKVSPRQGDDILPSSQASHSGYQGKDLPAFIHLQLHMRENKAGTLLPTAVEKTWVEERQTAWWSLARYKRLPSARPCEEPAMITRAITGFACKDH